MYYLLKSFNKLKKLRGHTESPVVTDLESLKIQAPTSTPDPRFSPTPWDLTKHPTPSSPVWSHTWVWDHYALEQDLAMQTYLICMARMSCCPGCSPGCGCHPRGEEDDELCLAANGNMEAWKLGLAPGRVSASAPSCCLGLPAMESQGWPHRGA